MVGSAVGGRARPGRATGRGIDDSVVAALADRRALLVLDNCEHLSDGVAPFVERLLARCPDVSVLTTSRARLMVPFEWVYPVPPLSSRTRRPRPVTSRCRRPVPRPGRRRGLDRGARAPGPGRRRVPQARRRGVGDRARCGPPARARARRPGRGSVRPPAAAGRRLLWGRDDRAPLGAGHAGLERGPCSPGRPDPAPAVPRCSPFVAPGRRRGGRVRLTTSASRRGWSRRDSLDSSPRIKPRRPPGCCRSQER